MPKFVSNTWLRQEAERLELIHLRAIRDELVAALESCANFIDADGYTAPDHELAYGLVMHAFKVIAKAKEQP
jgi:hypothetical protein